MKQKTKKLSWWDWLLVLLWIALMVFFLQYAIASMSEYESRAASISWIIFFVLLAFGIFFLIRKKRT